MPDEDDVINPDNLEDVEEIGEKPEEDLPEEEIPIDEDEEEDVDDDEEEEEEEEEDFE